MTIDLEEIEARARNARAWDGGIIEADGTVTPMVELRAHEMLALITRVWEAEKDRAVAEAQRDAWRAEAERPSVSDAIAKCFEGVTAETLGDVDVVGPLDSVNVVVDALDRLAAVLRDREHPR